MIQVKSIHNLLVFVVFTFHSCNNTYNSKAEAERSLKVMNSDLVNLFEKASEQKEFEALQFLWNTEYLLF